VILKQNRGEMPEDNVVNCSFHHLGKLNKSGKSPPVSPWWGNRAKGGVPNSE